MDLYDVIRRPVNTEKARHLSEANNQYTFEVDRSANKSQVKRAVETIYDVRVAAVNIINMPAKATRRWGRRRVVRRSTWKKAVVTLVAGDKIPLFEGG
jgi:large subunit ribosomal protein L23